LYPGHFGVQLVPRAPHTLEELEAALHDELNRLRDTPPHDAELTRVRNQLEAGRIRRLASNMGLAFQLAVSESLYGDWRATFEYTTRLQEVTPEDVQRVVKTYFLSERRTVTKLVPEDGDASGVATEAEPPEAVGAGSDAEEPAPGAGPDPEREEPEGELRR
ncbi:MAG: M16 family metallopeptidase, partial [Gemmatimonadota bacterium]